MAFHVRDAAADQAVRRLAALTGQSLTDTIRDAAERQYAALSGTPPLLQRIRAIQADFAAMQRAGGMAADKALFDELSGDI